MVIAVIYADGNNMEMVMNINSPFEHILQPKAIA